MPSRENYLLLFLPNRDYLAGMLLFLLALSEARGLISGAVCYFYDSHIFCCKRSSHGHHDPNTLGTAWNNNKRWFLPWIYFIQPGLFPNLYQQRENGTKENSAAGALRFSRVDVFRVGSLPGFTMRLFKRWHFNAMHPRGMGKAGSRADGPPWVKSWARRTSGDTGAATAGYSFYSFPPAWSLCFSSETELCFSLVARGSGLERGDFYWATKGIVCTGRKCVKNWNYMVVLGVCCGGNTGSRLLVANRAWWDDLKMKWVWYAGTWHLKRMVKLYFLIFSFVQGE